MFYRKKNIQIINYNYNYLDKKIFTIINNINNKFNLPNEIFVIALNYLNKLNNLNKNIILIDYIFIAIIVSLKYILDYSFNVKNMCNTIYYDYDKYITNELKFLHMLNWEVFIY